MFLYDLNKLFAPYADQGLSLARVSAVHRDRWELFFAESSSSKVEQTQLPELAELAGSLHRNALSPVDFPVVGDWVAAIPAGVDGAVTAKIVAILPRKGLLARKRPGDIEHDAVVEQALAANIDLALLVMGIDSDFSLRRLERYLSLAWDSGAKPLIILTKADLAGSADIPSIEERSAEVNKVSFGTQVLATSAHTGLGLEEMQKFLAPDTCSILLGSSGVGKSSLLNAIAGTVLQKEGDTRIYDGKGRHTTSSRRLVSLPWGAFLVDTPGMRELQLWGDEGSLASSFPDIQEFAVACHFSDCSHVNEPGCAVREALENGDLSRDRFESWQSLKRELSYLERKVDAGAARAERDKWKVIAKSMRTMKKRERVLEVVVLILDLLYWTAML